MLSENISRVVNLANACEDTLKSHEIAIDGADRWICHRRRGGSTTGSYVSTCPCCRLSDPDPMKDTPGLRIEDFYDDSQAEESPRHHSSLTSAIEKVVMEANTLEEEFKYDLPDIHGAFWRCDPRACVASPAVPISRGIGRVTEAVASSSAVTNEVAKSKACRKHQRVLKAAQPWIRPNRDAIAAFFPEQVSRVIPSQVSPIVVSDDSPADFSADHESNVGPTSLVALKITNAVDPRSVLSDIDEPGSHALGKREIPGAFPIRLKGTDAPIETCTMSVVLTTAVSSDPCLTPPSPTLSYHSSVGRTQAFDVATPPNECDKVSECARSIDSQEMWDPS